MVITKKAVNVKDELAFLRSTNSETEEAQPTLRTISLGGGVQSTVMLLMSMRGEFGAPPDLAIFADTGNEPSEVYDMIGWLSENSGCDVRTVSAQIPIVEALRHGIDSTGKITGLGVPFFTLNTRNSKQGMARRMCTSEWKIRPIETELRRQLGASRITKNSGISVEQWLGISVDEIERVKPSQTAWIVNRYPLIEANMSRRDCKEWWRLNAPKTAPPLARSACAICPYRSSEEWLSLQDDHPDMFAEACTLEADYNAHQKERGYGYMLAFLHHRRIPLAEAVDKDREARDTQGNLFARAGECSGSCWT